MAKKINTLEDFYNHLCNKTGSTWTGMVVNDTKHMFQDLCSNLSYVATVRDVLKNIKGASVAGVQDGMIFVLYDIGGKNAGDIDRHS